uniref:Ribosome biogenesis protein BRX1 homolog n=2 Tax=Ciona intestinalis TaxID=7719 RepID=F6UJD6_CIOIN
MPTLTKGRWKNKQKVLVFTSRGITYKGRHLVNDLRNLMPHTKTDVKMDRKSDLLMVNEICEIKSCNKCIFLVGKKKRDVYMWISNVPHGPSALFHVEYLNMMEELKFTGNCLKASRPILSFDSKFDDSPHMKLLKELFIQVFGTPNFHPKSQPFVDHVFTFSLMDGKIWFRNYQIVEENGELVEIGPRYTMTLSRILSGSFGGPILYINPDYQSPNLVRHLEKKSSTKYVDNKAAKIDKKMRRSDKTFAADETDQVFDTNLTAE